MRNDWLKALKGWGELQYDVLLSKHTTLAVGGKARYYFKPNSVECLQQTMLVIPKDMPLLALGRGSNLLISDQGFDGVVLDLGCLQKLVMNQDYLFAQAGCRMSKIAQLAASDGYCGLEFMATVPGDLGGGVAMNAGAFGQQVSDTLRSIEVVHRDGNMETLQREQLAMNYRHTLLPPASIVVSACFALQQGEMEDVRQRMREMRQQRSKTQPLALPNCGSVFKNPDGDYAARLIEAVGLKGACVGAATISEVHANFIVNHGGATSADVMALIGKVQKEVQKKFDVFLEPEVRILADFKQDDSV